MANKKEQKKELEKVAQEPEFRSGGHMFANTKYEYSAQAQPKKAAKKSSEE